MRLGWAAFVALVAAAIAVPATLPAANGPLVAVEAALYDCPYGCSPGGNYSLWAQFPNRPFAPLPGITRRLNHLFFKSYGVEPAISQDGRRVLYAGTRHRIEVARVSLARDTVLSPPRALLRLRRDDTIWAAAWSPRGDAVALLGTVHGREGLFTIRVDGTTLRRLVCDCTVAVPWFDTNAIVGGVAWSALDEIAFVGSDPRSASTAISLYAVHRDGRNLRVVQRVKGSSSYAVAPAFSADGSLLIYQVNVFRLYIRDMRRGTVRSLHLTGDQPTFAPDGTMIAYSHDARNRLVNEAAADGTHPLAVPAPDIMAHNSFVAGLSWVDAKP